jgi:hypothetical protein
VPSAERIVVVEELVMSLRRVGKRKLIATALDPWSRADGTVATRGFDLRFGPGPRTKPAGHR